MRKVKGKWKLKFLQAVGGELQLPCPRWLEDATLLTPAMFLSLGATHAVGCVVGGSPVQVQLVGCMPGLLPLDALVICRQTERSPEIAWCPLRGTLSQVKNFWSQWLLILPRSTGASMATGRTTQGVCFILILGMCIGDGVVVNVLSGLIFLYSCLTDLCFEGFYPMGRVSEHCFLSQTTLQSGFGWRRMESHWI